MSNEHDERSQSLTRRQALKALAAATGGAALQFIPKAWTTPGVTVGVLPAHAQISDCAGDMCAIATTTTMVRGQYGDFDFSLCTPNGNWVWGGNSADGAVSSLDNIEFTPYLDHETLDIGAGAAVAGVYSIYLSNYAAATLEITIQIITAMGVHTRTLTLNEDQAVADVHFPGGTVTWRSDLTWPECWNGEDIASPNKAK